MSSIPNRSIANNGDADAGGSGRLRPEDIDSIAVDNLLSQDLHHMSFQERERILEEIHGVSNLCPEETPELLRESLAQLALEVEAITHKPAYEEAQTFPNTYVNHDNFRLRFLRTDLFDAYKAAIRMVKYLELVKVYYGSVALQRPIQLSDLERQVLNYVNDRGCKCVAVTNVLV
jgi:hypothetical protein